MAHFTCESCGASLYTATRPARLIDPSCPTCGAPLQQQREVERERWDDEGLGRIPGSATAVATRLE
jgi:hypothetical protein